MRQHQSLHPKIDKIVKLYAYRNTEVYELLGMTKSAVVYNSHNNTDEMCQTLLEALKGKEYRINVTREEVVTRLNLLGFKSIISGVKEIGLPRSLICNNKLTNMILANMWEQIDRYEIEKHGKILHTRKPKTIESEKKDFNINYKKFENWVKSA